MKHSIFLRLMLDCYFLLLLFYTYMYVLVRLKWGRHICRSMRTTTLPQMLDYRSKYARARAQLLKLQKKFFEAWNRTRRCKQQQLRINVQRQTLPLWCFTSPELAFFFCAYAHRERKKHSSIVIKQWSLERHATNRSLFTSKQVSRHSYT